MRKEIKFKKLVFLELPKDFIVFKQYNLSSSKMYQTCLLLMHLNLLIRKISQMRLYLKLQNHFLLLQLFKIKEKKILHQLWNSITQWRKKYHQNSSTFFLKYLGKGWHREDIMDLQSRREHCCLSSVTIHFLGQGNQKSSSFCTFDQRSHWSHSITSVQMNELFLDTVNAYPPLKQDIVFHSQEWNTKLYLESILTWSWMTDF